jgi:hypothetical protein
MKKVQKLVSVSVKEFMKKGRHIISNAVNKLALQN